MNLFKSAALSLVLLSSLANAKVTLEAAIVENANMISIPAMTLELNEPSVQFVGDVRFEATLTEANSILMGLAFKDENGSYVSYLQPELALNEEETKGALEFTTKNGDQLVILVHANTIKE